MKLGEEKLNVKLNQSLRYTAKQTAIQSKTDLRVWDFDNEQMNIFNRIRFARSTLERNFSNNYGREMLSSSTRRLKQA
jgi:hypothetical protein